MFEVRFVEDIERFPVVRDGFERVFVLCRSQKLWRFLSVERAEAMIRDQTLYLSAFCTFEDSLEGSVPVWTSAYWRKRELENGWQNGTADKILGQLEEKRARCFASCWRADDSLYKEGFHKYDRGSPCVCIETKAEQFVQTLSFAIENDRCISTANLGIGYVRYLDHELSRVPTHNSSFHLMIKNKDEYSWEREVRILLVGRDMDVLRTEGSDSFVKGYRLKLDCLDWISAVHLNGLAEGSQASSLISLLEKVQLPIFE